MNKSRTFSITTLGCKVNQFESQVIARRLEDAGLTPCNADENTRLCIINTCTVTGKAAMQSRQAIRQAIRHHPDARIIVTGCYAQTAPEEIEAIPGVTALVPQSQKQCVADIALERPCRPKPSESRGPRTLEHLVAGGRGRPFLKIQDGCEAFCTYCIVPYARGPSRSVPVAAVLESLRKLRDEGFSEAVLTGIHLGIYGRDLQPPAALSGLLAQISRQQSIHRVRLSSIEPGELVEEILGAAADTERRAGRLCPHFHIPLQSGDAGILRRMGRPYTPEFFSALLENVRHLVPHAAIGSDVLVGFPGESETAFQNTLQRIQDAPLTYLHVFPFSPRKGTPAASLPNPVAPAVIKARCRQLRKIGMQKKSEFYNQFVDKKLEVVLENQIEADLWQGTSENYIPMRVRTTKGRPGKGIAAKVTQVSADLVVTGSADPQS
ncbi:MAG TPA: tRNA (N(6)-L-threonylcarbamoyladenosine(37)-C(2))-methylthiotransferase MtaB [Desulfobacterales bacterium]